MYFDAFQCDEKELAKFLFSFISFKGQNDPEVDRRAISYSLEQLSSQLNVESPMLSFPAMVLWKITGECNSKCSHCWANLGHAPKRNELITVAEELRDNGALMVSLSGGEPFLCDDIFDIIKILKERNIIIDILSNGSLLDETVVRKLSRILNRETDTIQISLDGSTGSIHDSQRGMPIFDYAVSGIRLLKEYEFKVRNVFVATPINQFNLFETYKLSCRLGVDVFAPCPVFPLRKGKNFKNTIDSVNYLRQVAACKSIEHESATKLRIQVDQYYQYLLNKYFNEIGYAFLNQLNGDRIRIPETNTSMQIDASGNALPGPEWEIDMSAGNVYQQSVKEVWRNGINWGSFRKGRCLKNSRCSNCRIFDICCGGNAKLAYDTYETIDMPDGTCMIGGV